MDAPTVTRLRAIPIFAGLSDDAIAAIAARSWSIEASHGHVLMEIGRPGAGLFVVEEGELTVEFPGGRSVSLGPGEFVGELALLTDAPHTGRVCAVGDVRCLAIDREAFLALLNEHPRLAVDMLPVLARRLVDARAGRG